MGSRIGWAGLALAAIAVSLWWFRAGESAEAVDPPDAVVIEPSRVPESTQAAPPAHVPQQKSTAPHSDVDATTVADALSAEQSDLAVLSETWTLSGFVLEVPTRDGCAGFRVLGPPSFDARCDSDGRFEVELDAARDPPGCTRVLHIYDTQSQRRTTKAVRLVQGLVLEVESQALLRGRVVDPAGLPVPAELVVLSTGRGNDLSVSVDENDGSFETPVPKHGLRSEMVELQFTIGRSEFSAVCPAAELLQPWGATVVLDLCEVRLRLHTSDGVPVRFADLWMEGRRPNAMSRSRHFRLRADSEGLVGVTLERDLTDLWIVASPHQSVSAAWGDESGVSFGLGGHEEWSEHRDRPPCDSIWEIPFHRLGTGDRITGRLLLPDGSPPQRAVVVCRPEKRPWSQFSMGADSVAQTDADGSFSLPWPEGRSAHLRGGSDSLGWSRGQPLVGGDRDVEIRLEPMQMVSVSFVEPEEDLPSYSQGGLSYWLELEDGRVESGRGDVAGLTLKHVPIGHHRLSAFAWIPSRFGAVEFDVVEGLDPRAEVPLRRGRTAFGKVVDATGLPLHGALVRLLDMDWPSESDESPFVNRTDINGRFTIEIGDRDQADLEISLEDRSPVRVTVQADTPATWTLP